MNTKECTLSGLLKLEESSTQSEFRAKLASQKDKLQVGVVVPWKQIEQKMVEKIVKLLDIKLLSLCLDAWKKYQELQEFTDTKKYPPDEENEVALLEHEILSEQHPGMEITVDSLHFKRSITLDLDTSLKLKGCSLVIRNGRIMKALPGKCSGEATLKFEGVVLAAANSNDIALGEAVELGEGIPIAPPAHELPVTKPAVAA